MEDLTFRRIKLHIPHLSPTKTLIHIDNTTKKANQTLGFLKRNIRVHNKDLKSVAYKTLVRPQLEYASTVWYPHHDKDINKVEAVQRRAARWTIRDYKYTSSVTAMFLFLFLFSSLVFPRCLSEAPPYGVRIVYIYFELNVFKCAGEALCTVCDTTYMYKA